MPQKKNTPFPVRLCLVILFFAHVSFPVFSQTPAVLSPNEKIRVDLLSRQNADVGEWYLKVSYLKDQKTTEAIPRINLGLSRSDQDFLKDLKLLKASKLKVVREHYVSPHGKRSERSNTANEIIVSFENRGGAKLNIIIRAYDDGVTFRYEFPEKQGSFVIKDEFTSYAVQPESKRWVEKWNPANRIGVTQRCSRLSTARAGIFFMKLMSIVHTVVQSLVTQKTKRNTRSHFLIHRTEEEKENRLRQ
jgi:hypothetical protein